MKKKKIYNKKTINGVKKTFFLSILNQNFLNNNFRFYCCLVGDCEEKIWGKFNEKDFFE